MIKRVVQPHLRPPKSQRACTAGMRATVTCSAGDTRQTVTIEGYVDDLVRNPAIVTRWFRAHMEFCTWNRSAIAYKTPIAHPRASRDFSTRRLAAVNGVATRPCGADTAHATANGALAVRDIECRCQPRRIPDESGLRSWSLTVAQRNQRLRRRCRVENLELQRCHSHLAAAPTYIIRGRWFVFGWLAGFAVFALALAVLEGIDKALVGMDAMSVERTADEWCELQSLGA